MWPRTDPAATGGAAAGRSKNSGFSGFVAYMRRKDAENALRELDGFSWSGSILRVGWSKSVPVPARPMYGMSVAFMSIKQIAKAPPVNPAAQSLGDKDQPSTTALSRKRSRSRDRDYDRHERRSHRSRSRSPRHSGRDRRPSRSRSYERSHRSRQDRSRSPRRRSRSRSRDARDQDDLGEEISDGFIRTVASQVKGNDEVYEKSLMDYESKNPRYAFFQDRVRAESMCEKFLINLHPQHPKHRYYRSCLDKRREIQPEFDDDGYNSSYSTDSEEEEERENGHKTELGRLARRRFQAMLRGISGRRGELARCMAFSLEHAEAAAEVADVLIASLLVEGTPVPRKVSRLHLVCDILHNSAIPLPGAWRFRQEFQSRLGLVFDHLAGIYHSFPGRITADTFKTQITAIIDIWEDWIVFPPEFTAQLRMRLEGQSSTTDEEVADAPVVTSAEPDVVPELPRFKASSFKPAAPPTLAEASAAGHEDIDGAPIGGIDDDLDGASVEDVDGASIEDVDGAPFEDLDGVPLEDLDGSPLRDPDGVPLDDMDGAPLDDVDGTPPEGDDVDGAPLNDDVDGVPMDLEA
jgi:U2-associated protein SR140